MGDVMVWEQGCSMVTGFGGCLHQESATFPCLRHLRLFGLSSRRETGVVLTLSPPSISDGKYPGHWHLLYLLLKMHKFEKSAFFT